MLSISWSGESTVSPMPATHRILGCTVRSGAVSVLYEAEPTQSTITRSFQVISVGDLAPAGYTPLCVVGGSFGSAVYWK